MTETTDQVRSNGLVLIADDDPVNLEVLYATLAPQGFEVAVASDGKVVLEMVLVEPPDLILLDVMMPGMDGFETCRRLKANEATRDIPVIFMTSMNETAYRVRGLRFGAVDYIAKPFEEAELLARVSTQLSLRRMTQTLQAQNAQLAEQLRNNMLLQKNLEREKAELVKVNQELLRSREQTVEVFEAMSEILPGKVLDGKYRVETILGSGGFGVVYRATQLALDRSVALKVIFPKNTLSFNEHLDFFRVEGISTSRVNHPNAVMVFDANTTNGISYLAMELLEGQTLAAELAKRELLSIERCNQIIVPVCDVLAYAHSIGIIHCDIKPGNIFLHKGRSGEIVKVLDFGIARLAGKDGFVKQDETDSQTTTSGTPAYMAPERLLGESYDGRVDVYSVGLILTGMLCGLIPPPNREPRQPGGGKRSACSIEQILGINPKVPYWAANLISQALICESELRPTMRQFLDNWNAAAKEHIGSSPIEGDPPAAADGDAILTAKTNNEDPEPDSEMPTLFVPSGWTTG